MSKEIKVWGVTFDNEDGINRQDLLKAMAKHDRVVLVEENNLKDPLAIAVLDEKGNRLGYVGKDDPAREIIRLALGCGELHARVAHILNYGESKSGKKYSIGLRIEYAWRLMKDGDYTTTTWDKPMLPNTEQKPKRRSKTYKEALVKYKRHHPERLSYHELQAIKERRVG